MARGPARDGRPGSREAHRGRRGIRRRADRGVPRVRHLAGRSTSSRVRRTASRAPASPRSSAARPPRRWGSTAVPDFIVEEFRRRPIASRSRWLPKTAPNKRVRPAGSDPRAPFRRSASFVGHITMFAFSVRWSSGTPRSSTRARAATSASASVHTARQRGTRRSGGRPRRHRRGRQAAACAHRRHAVDGRTTP